MTQPTFSSEQIKRYSRQLVQPEFGFEGQSKLMDSSVLIIGLGALGCPAAMYLSSMGCGRIGLMDDDTVELSNLHRQILFSEDDLGKSKILTAAEKITKMNNNVTLGLIELRADPENLTPLILSHDIVLDATDTFAAKSLINRKCCELGKPLVSGGALGRDGQILSVFPGESPCFACVFGDQSDDDDCLGTCAEAGVIPTVTGLVGSLMANEALNILTGKGRNLAGRLLLVNSAESTFFETETAFRKNCFCSAKKL